MERVSVDAENVRRFTPVSVGMRKHDFKERFLENFSDIRIEFSGWRVGFYIMFNVRLVATRLPEHQGSRVRLPVPIFQKLHQSIQVITSALST